MSDGDRKLGEQFGAPYIQALVRQTEQDNGLFMEERFLAPVLLRQLRPIRGTEFLEVGCGILINSRRILLEAPARLRLVDISQEMLEAAEHRLPGIIAELDYKPNIRFAQRSGDKTMYEADRFDIANSVFVVENMPDGVVSGHLTEMFRVLKPGGRYVMAGLHPLWLLLVSGGGADKPAEWPERFRNYGAPHNVVIERTESHKYTREYRSPEWYLAQAISAGFRLGNIESICVPTDDAVLAEVPEKYHPKRGWPLFWVVTLTKPL